MSAPASSPGRRPAPLRVLHVAAEVFPLVKTGGLADVVAALPPALARAGADVRLLLPGLPAIVESLAQLRSVARIGAMFGAAKVNLLRGLLPGTQIPAYVVDAPLLYRRGGSPYQDSRGNEWPDNLQRFALLGWAGAHLASGELDEHWAPDLLHGHDWHAGLACAYAALHPGAVRGSLFTVHNLAFQGLFPLGDFPLLGLPARLLGSQGLEFHGQLSFMKGGLKFADRITTVSPSYAREIATHEFGAGLDGVIRKRQHDVSGILNGVDTRIWDPAGDSAIASRYDRDRPEGKALCKAALQRELGLEPAADAPLLGVVSRLGAQKGLDLVLQALPAALALGAQLAVVGTGDPVLEAAFSAAQALHGGRVAVRLAYDEALAHRVIAGADAILVPSRFEPCGLTQMYGLRYGTLPLVRRVGGLADTVVDADEEALRDGRATGVVFDAATAEALGGAIGRLVALYRRPDAWRGLMRTAMAQDFSWDHAAADYLRLYRDLLAAGAHAPAPARR